MKMLMMLMMPLVLIVACGKDGDKERRGERHSRDLTLKLEEKTVDGELRIRLMLCEDYGGCHNTLLERDGDSFYFTNSRKDYRKKYVRKKHFETGNGRRRVVVGYDDHDDSSDDIYGRRGRNAGLFVSIGSGVSVGFSYGLRSKESYRYRSGNRNRDYLRGRGSVHRERSVYRDNGEFRKQSSFLRVNDIAIERTELVDEIADSKHWENREQSLRKLFVHSDEIRVTKREARSLLKVVADRFDVVIAADVEDIIDLR